MKKIYILLMQTNTMPSRLIKVFTQYEYSHVAISLEKDCYITYSFGRRRVNSIIDGGFVIEQKDGEFFKKFNQTNCKIYEIEVNEKQYRKLRKMLKRMEHHQDKYQYDFIGIICRYFKIPITFRNKYVCSYFVASLLEKAKICYFEKEPYFIVPKDFENIPCFNEIYDGKYLLYQN